MADKPPKPGVAPGGVHCACGKSVALPDFTMAFQPIVDLEEGEIYAHEALVRPPGDGSAAQVLGQIDEANRHAFDQACRVKAIGLAAGLGMQSFLSINFLPNAVCEPAACLRRTFEAAESAGFPVHHLIFEATEAEQSRDPAKLRTIFREYRRRGMLTAIDDFGAGHSGLNLLAEFQPDILKLDMALIRNVHADPVRFAIVKSVASLCRDLHISIIAKGIESFAEAVALRHLGIRLFQGYLFARPMLEGLPQVPQSLTGEICERFLDELLDPDLGVDAADARQA